MSKKLVRRGVSLVGGGGVALLLGLVAAASVAVPACSSKFSDCSDSYTCAAGGTSGGGGIGGSSSAGSGGASGSKADLAGAPNGEAGASGAAGAGGQPECTTDADCDDHDPCTATDTCKDSVCVHGDSPCVNPDVKNCDELCSNSSGKAKCTTVGQDADGDKHLSAACAAAPGDDCDDTQPTVYKGAKEICDGLDNDCNGKIDLYDGLPIANTQVHVSSLGDDLWTEPRIAWEPTSKVFGITWVFAATGSTSQSVAFTAFDMTGNNVVTPRIVRTVAGTISDARIAARGGTFGILWAVDYTNGQHAIAFDTVSPTGTVDSAPLFPAPAGTNHVFNPRIVIGAAGWDFAWLEYGTDPTLTSAQALTLDDGGQMTAKHELMAPNARTSFAFAVNDSWLVAADATPALGFGLGSPSSVNTYGYTPSSMVTVAAALTNVSTPLLVAGGDDFLLAVSDNSAVGGQVALLKPPTDTIITDPNQVIECGPVVLPFEPESAIWLDADHGYLVSSRSTFVNVSSKCEVSPAAGALENPGDVASAGATTGLGFVSSDSHTTINFRPLSPLLCK